MSPTLILLMLTIMESLSHTCAVRVLKKSLNTPCNITSSEFEHDNNTEDSSYEDDEADSDSFHIMPHHDNHEYKRSIMTDPYPEPEDDCEKDNQLKCINGTCQVHCDPKKQVMDSQKLKCLGKAGFPCGRNGRNHSLCVLNARCTLGYCECDKGYGRKDHLCIPAANYKQSCDSDRPCDKNGAMECINGRCECSFGSENQWYDPKRKACLSYAEGKCTADALCANNSLCSKTGYNIELLPIEDELPPYTNRTCRCKKGFMISNNNKTCLASNGTSCHKFQCHEKFKCVNGVCLCLNPSYEVFDEMQNQCLSLVGKSCNSSVGCVHNAACVDGECVCQNGYSSGQNGKCYLDFGQPCVYVRNSRSTYRQSTTQICNDFRQLACIQNVCDCLDSIHVYDRITKNCVLPQHSSPTFSNAVSPMNTSRLTQQHEQSDENFQDVDNFQDDEKVHEMKFSHKYVGNKFSCAMQLVHNYPMFLIFVWVLVNRCFASMEIFALG